jgi:predicted MFS family arabinose efflux permease
MTAADTDRSARPRTNVTLGLRANWRQFTLLILINAFVGGMVGIERTVVPLIGSEQFGIASTTFVVSFIVSFGVVKAFANLVSGQLADLWGRKRVLILGWLFGMPVPFMIMWAPSWAWVVAANALLGVNQGLAWSMTVIMKIDLVGPKSRGLAVGLNEFAGYLAVGITAFLTGYIAAQYGLRPAPIYLGSLTLCSVRRFPLPSSATPGITCARRSAIVGARLPRSISGKSLPSPPSATAICSQRPKPGS